MTTPCEQEPVILNINKTLERMERTQDRLVIMMEKVSDQGAKIMHLSEQTKTIIRDVDILFDRVRSLELEQITVGPEVKLAVQESFSLMSENVDKILNKMSIMTSRPVYMAFIVTAALTLVGTICDLMYHFDTLKAILELIK